MSGILSRTTHRSPAPEETVLVDPVNVLGLPESTVETLDDVEGAALLAAALRYEFFGDFAETIQVDGEVVHAGVSCGGKVVDIHGIHDKHDWVLSWKLELARPDAVRKPVLVSSLGVSMGRDEMSLFYGQMTLAEVVATIRNAVQ